MNRRTIKTLVFVALLAALAADLSVGCGQGYVYGPVTQKFTSGEGVDQTQLAVNGDPYLVPYSFYQQVRIGDIVKFDGKEWTIVKRAGAITP